MLSARQIEWAKSHDWFIRDNRDGTIEVNDRWSQLHKDGSLTWHDQQLTHAGSFKALRDWAGY